MRCIRSLMIATVLTAPLPAHAAGAAAGAAAPGAGEAVPKVLYIVPWKQLEARRTEPEPPTPRIERVPEVLDRDAFRRELELRRRLEQAP